MPNITLHLFLAERTLEHWSLHPEGAPFPLDDARFTHAFFQGSFGPDLGYFPGGHRFFSDLAHCVGSGDLARALLSTARTPMERAFAWGWVTHILADRLVHPLVGRALGELRTGDRERFIAADDDTPGHVRVETGLDAWVSTCFPELREQAFPPVFDGMSVGFLSRAYERAYALRIDPALFLGSYQSMIRMGKTALISMPYLLHRCELTRPGSRVLLALSAWAERMASPGRLTLAYLTPVPPSPWFQDEVMEVASRFPAEMDRIRADPRAGLPNLNLDTAEPEGEATQHRGAARTRARLGALLSGGSEHYSGAVAHS